MSITDLQHARNVVEKLEDALRSAREVFVNLTAEDIRSAPSAGCAHSIGVLDNGCCPDCGEFVSVDGPGTDAPVLFCTVCEGDDHTAYRRLADRMTITLCPDAKSADVVKALGKITAEAHDDAGVELCQDKSPHLNLPYLCTEPKGHPGTHRCEYAEWPNRTWDAVPDDVGEDRLTRILKVLRTYDHGLNESAEWACAVEIAAQLDAAELGWARANDALAVLTEADGSQTSDDGSPDRRGEDA